jgi:hypothetical protein
MGQNERENCLEMLDAHLFVTEQPGQSLRKVSNTDWKTVGDTISYGITEIFCKMTAFLATFMESFLTESMTE